MYQVLPIVIDTQHQIVLDVLLNTRIVDIYRSLTSSSSGGFGGPSDSQYCIPYLHIYKKIKIKKWGGGGGGH